MLAKEIYITSSSLRRSKGLKGAGLRLEAASSDASLSSASCSTACAVLSLCRCLAAIPSLCTVTGTTSFRGLQRRSRSHWVYMTCTLVETMNTLRQSMTSLHWAAIDHNYGHAVPSA